MKTDFQEPVIESLVAEGKIHQALTRLGVSFIDAMDLVRYDPAAPTAYWSYNPATGEQTISIGSSIVMLDLSSIEMVLRHEFLHRSTYHGFHERFSDPQLLNIVQDVCINRMLYEAYPEKMQKLSLQIYWEAKKSIIALADCSADPAQLPSLLSDLWRYIWEPDQNGLQGHLNPTSLYYRLVELRKEAEVLFTITISVPIFAEHTGFPDTMPGKMEQTMESVLQAIDERLPGTSGIAGVMNTFINSSFQFKTDVVKNFLASLDVDRIVSNSRQNLLETVRYSANSILPLFPSRQGLVFLSTGLSDILGMYNNTYTYTKPYRLKICFYVDVSDSMSDFFGHVHYFIRAVVDVPLEIQVFDDSLRAIEVEDFVKGTFSVGGGTDFDIVLEDFVTKAETGAAVIFTDGDASISEDNQRKLRASGKQLYVVYFVPQGSSKPKSPLNSLSERVLVMPVMG